MTAQGAQRPRIVTYPKSVSSSLSDVVDLLKMTTLELDPWQQFVLERGLGEGEDGKWSAFEVATVCGRQNGKTQIGLARELVGLFVLHERLIVHSAHQFDTSLESFRALLTLIEDTPELDRRVKRVSRSHGDEGIELKDGCRIRFRTRTSGGGRGFTADCLILDEAMILPEAMIGALLPTLSARPNPQVWYFASAVDKEIHDHGVALARLRERALAGGDDGLAYFEWSIPVELEDIGPEIAGDPEYWALANPSLGIRISAEHIANERASMDPRTFAVERLGAGDWPSTDPEGERIIDADAWNALIDETSEIVGPVVFGYDVQPNREGSSIAAAGRRSDGLMHVELVTVAKGTSWIPGALRQLIDKAGRGLIVCDGIGPGTSLVPAIEQQDLTVVTTSARQFASACAGFYDAVKDASLRHLGSPELAAAIDGAARRPLGESFAWSRRNSSADISPLCAATLSLWGAMTALPPKD